MDPARWLRPAPVAKGDLRLVADKTGRCVGRLLEGARVGGLALPSAYLTYLNNRYHDPTTGVFLTVDPLVATTGQPYLYAAGNPTTLSDPNGLCAQGALYAQWDDGKPCHVDEKIPAALERSKSNADLIDAVWGTDTGCWLGNWYTWDTGVRAYPEDEGLLELAGLFDMGLLDVLKIVSCPDVGCQVDVLRHDVQPGLRGRTTEPIDQEVMDEVLVWAGVQQVDACGTSSSGATVYCAAVTRLPSLKGGTPALTIGHFILYDITEPGRIYRESDSDPYDLRTNPKSYRHEMAHVDQYELYGTDMLWGLLPRPRSL